MRSPFRVLVLAVPGVPLFAHAQQPSPLPEVVVTASLRPAPVEEVPMSVSVLDGETLQRAGQQHFEDVLGLVPNLDWAGDTSRPRYFQLRGIGELEQYQGAPNPSVGVLFDDIDFSGLGSVATLYDVDQIEVLRGPQGTRYGANALGGLIYVRSAAPEDHFDARADLTAGDYATRSYGAMLTGPVDALDSSFRLAAQKYLSDGYYTNAYLGRNDTDAVDETTVRGRWRWSPSALLQLDLTLLELRMDNGYDAWTLDGTRTTRTDQPGEDVQHSTGAAAHLTYRGLGPTLTLIGTWADSRIVYGFDADFGNPQWWAPYTYTYSDTQQRERKTNTAEMRLASAGGGGVQWLAGLYSLGLAESFDDRSPGVYVDPFDPTQNSTVLSVTTSEYSSRNTAVFGELDGELAHRWNWSLGARLERRTADYHDRVTNLGEPDATHAFAPQNGMWGGQASLEYALEADQRLYALISRGYKAGGFNLGPGLPPGQILFSPEWDLNYELGYKAELAEHHVRLDADVFYMQRHSLQIVTGEQLAPDNPDTFVLYTTNAPSGRNYGLESTLRFASGGRFEASAALGLLNTAYHGLTLNGVLLPDRALPHAPDWNAALSGTVHGGAGSYLRIDLTGMDGFYYDVPALDPYKSGSYVLVNARLGIERGHWSASLWVRNLADRNHAVRGFYFGDVPPNFPNQQFIQLGPPRTFGGSLTWKLE